MWQRTLDQMTEIFVEPEIKRRGFKEKVFAFLVTFKEGEKPEVRLNSECGFELTIDPSAGDKFVPGQEVLLSDVARYKFTNLMVPPDVQAQCAYFAAFTNGKEWTFKFDFSYNRSDADNRIMKAKQFLTAAKGSADNSIKAYQLFHALEQALHAWLILMPGNKAKLAKDSKHKSIKPAVNSHTRLGNIPEAVTNLFNSLVDHRSAIYGKGTVPNITDQDVQVVDDFIGSVESRTTEGKR
jgi:hypothetical protein